MHSGGWCKAMANLGLLLVPVAGCALRSGFCVAVGAQGIIKTACESCQSALSALRAECDKMAVLGPQLRGWELNWDFQNCSDAPMYSTRLQT